MTFRKQQPHRSPIGLDVGSRHITAVQMHGDTARPRIAAAIALPRQQPGSDLLTAELRLLPTILRRAGFIGNKIVLATPVENQLGGVLEIPQSDPTAQAQMARMELARTNRCAPDSFELECWQLPDAVSAGKTTGTQVMAVACRHDHASAFLDPFEAAGFVVESLDLRAAALARAAGPFAAQVGHIVAILELNWQATLLVLVYRGEVIYERKLADSDLQRVYDTLVQRLQLDAELADYLLLEAGLDAMPGDAPAARQARTILSGYIDGLSTELSASLAYATERYEGVVINALLLCGDGAVMPGLDRRLAEATRIATRKIAPADVCENVLQDSEMMNSPGMVAAMGLAL